MFIARWKFRHLFFFFFTYREFSFLLKTWNNVSGPAGFEYRLYLNRKSHPMESLARFASAVEQHCLSTTKQLGASFVSLFMHWTVVKICYAATTLPSSCSRLFTLFSDGALYLFFNAFHVEFVTVTLLRKLVMSPTQIGVFWCDLYTGTATFGFLKPRQLTNCTSRLTFYANSALGLQEHIAAIHLVSILLKKIISCPVIVYKLSCLFCKYVVVYC